MGSICRYAFLSAWPRSLSPRNLFQIILDSIERIYFRIRDFSLPLEIHRFPIYFKSLTKIQMKLSGIYELTKFRTKNFWFGIHLTVGFLCLIVFILYKLPAGFWLDETLTAWIICEDFQTAFNRALHFQAWSPLYYLLIHGWARIFGMTEIALRLFSICAFVFGCLFLYKTYRRYFCRELSIFGTILSGVFLLLYVPVLYARPYGLIALFLISSFYFFVIWLDTGQRGAQILHIICSVCTIYTHWLFGTILIVQTLLVFCIKISPQMHYRRKWIYNLFIIGILTSPNAYRLALIFPKRFTYSYLTSPSIFNWAIITFPPGAILLSLWALWIVYRRKRLNHIGRFFSSISIGAVWIIVPPTILFLFSLFSGVSVLSPRYAGASYTGFGLIIISLFACLGKSFHRSFTMLYTSFLAIFMLLALPNISESWREPTAFLLKQQIKNHRPILLATGLIEATSREWILDSSKRDYLCAPIQYYLPTENPVPLPWANDLCLLKEVLDKSNMMNTLRLRGFFFVNRDIKIIDGDVLILSREVYKRYFLDHGFSVTVEKIFPSISVLEFVPNIEP